MKESNDAADDMPKLSLEQENEFKRLKLELESGAVLPDFAASNMPPEVEGLFLDNLFHFHDAYKNAKQISVYDRIGSPEFELAQALTDEEISVELDKLINKLTENGIGFETLFDYNERLIYEFITAELFDVEVDDIRIENLIMHFVYEEFHPNHEEDIKGYCETFWAEFLKYGDDQEAPESDVDLGIKNHEELTLFRNLFASFDLKQHAAENVVFNLEKKSAIADVRLNFLGFLSGQKEPVVFDGCSKIKLKYKYGYWHIVHVALVKN